MFIINDDMSIYVTRGDALYFTLGAEENGVPYIFQAGDVVRVKVFEKKNCDNVVMQKDFPIMEATETVNIMLTTEDTKIGDVISKPVDYWYEVELNPFTNPQTIVGYDDDGAKIFKLFPEGRDLTTDIQVEDIPVVDADLDLASERPVQNQAVARAIVGLGERMDDINETIKETVAGVVKNEEINARLDYNAETEALTIMLSNVGGIDE